MSNYPIILRFSCIPLCWEQIYHWNVQLCYTSGVKMINGVGSQPVVGMSDGVRPSVLKYPLCIGLAVLKCPSALGAIGVLLCGELTC